MKLKLLVSLVVATVLTTACTQNENLSSYPKGIEHVYVIGIDAMSVEGLKQATTPNMDRLIREGVICNRVRTVQPSSSAANWGSMLLGAGTEIHGITSNDWRIDDHSLYPTVVNEQGYFPSVLSVIRAQRPDDELGMLYHWDGFGDLFEKNLANTDRTFATEKETAYAIADYIREKKPRFIFSQLDDVDAAGHHYGHMTPGYLASIASVDTLVGVILQAVDDAKIADKTMIMIVSDHGGIGYGHGGTNWEEITVPFILYGAGVKKNYTVPTEVYMFDVAPTLVFALGLNEPYAWRGKAIKCAFEGFSAPSDPLPLKRLANAPAINGGRHLFEQAGGLFIDTDAQVEIKTNEDNSDIYYTLDGSEPTLKSPLYAAPFSLNNTCVVKAKSFKKDGSSESLVAEGFFRFVTTNGTNGLHTAFYPGKNWTSVPDFKKLTPVKNWESHEIQLDKVFVDALRPKGESSFGIVFSGKIEIEKAGEYTFYLQSDDGSILYVNNQQVVNNDGDHGVIEKQGSITLEKGRHDLRVEFINAGGGYWIDAFYKGPGITKQIIPAGKLYLK